MRKIYIATLFSLLLAGAARGAIQFTIRVTSATTFQVWMRPDLTITPGGAGISSMGMTFETPPSVNPSGSPSPNTGLWTVVSNPAFFPASPALLSTQFKQNAGSNWESNFNWNNGTGAGNQSFTAGTEYLLATFTIPAGLAMSDVTMKDWDNNKVDNAGAPLWGVSIAMGGAPNGIEQPAGIFYATTGSTSAIGNSGTATGTSTMTLTPIALPVTFLSFDARKEDPNVVLAWKTADEANVKGYYVQRSGNGTSWVNLGFVATLGGYGNNSYGYTDAAPGAGDNYYRIAEQDLDGALLYSLIRDIRFSAGDFSATLYPIPATTTVTVTTRSPVEEQAVLRITDMQGRTVGIQEVALVKGEATLATLDITRYAAGAYTVEIRSASVTWTGRFSKK
jgi:hypothetical protein